MYRGYYGIVNPTLTKPCVPDRSRTRDRAIILDHSQTRNYIDARSLRDKKVQKERVDY
jgi:hypothetical protein